MSIPSTKEIVALLAASDAFAGTPEKELSSLAESFTEKPVAEGEIVIEEDATGGEVYLVIDGIFRVFTGESESGSDSDQEEVRLLQSGDVFGEIAAMTGGRRMATVTAASDGMLLALSEVDFRRVLQNSPEMVESICNSMARYFDAD